MSFQLTGSGPEIYETTMVPLWFGRWAEELLALVSLKAGEKVLDIACGTGVTTRIAKQLVGKSGSVTGLDINEGMIAKASDLARELEITWTQSDVVGTDLPSGHFDAVISQHGYHYFPDKPAALNEFLRVLAPNGRVALSIWDGHCAYTRAICAAVETHISPEIAAKQSSQRETPTAAQLVQDLTAAGFRNAKVVRQELSIKVPLAAEFVPLHLASMPIADAFHALPEIAKEALIADVGAALSTHIVGRHIVYPDAVNVVFAEK